MIGSAKSCELPIHEIAGFEDLLTDKARKIYNTPQKDTVIKTAHGWSACQSFYVPVTIPGDYIPPNCISKMAFVFDALCDAGALDHGMLIKASWMELAQVTAKTRRVLLMFTGYPSEHISNEKDPLKALNEAAGEVVFCSEGSIADECWDKLPLPDQTYTKYINLPKPEKMIDPLATRASLVSGVAQWIASIVARRHKRDGIAVKRVGLDEATFMALFEDVVWYKAMTSTAGKLYPLRPRVEIVTADGFMSLIQIETLPGFDGDCCKTLVYPIKQQKTYTIKKPWWKFWGRK